MFCSTIIPTIGRSSLTRAVESVLKQSLLNGDFEVLVINDSNAPLAGADWQKSDRVRVIDTNQRERSVARNTGAAIAKGNYLHFLDDDDWLAPAAFQHFWELSQDEDAKWLYGITQLVDRQDNPSIQLEHSFYGNFFVQVMSGEWIPLQSSLIDRETFLKLGGFNPLLTGPEDIDLLRRFLLEEDLAETPHLIANVIMGGKGSTTDYDRHPEASRWAREKILDMSGTYHRMHLSARNAFWRGRMSRIYLTSVVWNLKHRRFISVLDRLFISFVSMLTTGAGLVEKDFWKAVTSPYASITFEKGIQEARLAEYLDS